MRGQRTSAGNRHDLRMRTVLITLIGPERTADLVVDADTPVSKLLPNLLAAGAIPEPEDPGWRLALMGKQPIDHDQTLEESGVLDGAVLVLRREGQLRSDAVLAAPGAARPAGSPLERDARAA